MILCKDCNKCKTVPVAGGRVATCKALPAGKRGIQIWKRKVNPRCPLKENQEYLKGVVKG